MPYCGPHEVINLEVNEGEDPLASIGVLQANISNTKI